MLMAILGRGIQRSRGSVSWEFTEDLEVCAPDRTHLADRVHADDQNPCCLVGGGELNLLAGLELHRRTPAEIVVCAYSHRAGYLVETDGPSESEVMSARLTGFIHENRLRLPKIEVWSRDRFDEASSNTHCELENAFTLARERGIRRVSVVTVSVHLPRAMLFARDLTEKQGDFRNLEVSFFASEQVLVEACPRKYAPRVLALYASQAYARTAFYERRGSVAFLEGRY